MPSSVCIAICPFVCLYFCPAKAKNKKMKCVFLVGRQTVIFGPDPKLFCDTCSRKLFKCLIFAFQCSNYYFDKYKLNVSHEEYMQKCILDAIKHQFSYKN